MLFQNQRNIEVEEQTMDSDYIPDGNQGTTRDYG